jgi:hypothetical protein
MAYWVKRIILKTGEVVTERELKPDENFSQGEAPMVGSEISVTCRGRTFKARVLWPKSERRAQSPEAVVPLRVEEI